MGLSKDIDFRYAESLGMQWITDLTNQIEGAIKLDREGGTIFKITF